MGNEIGRAPFIIERDQREIHIFLEKGQKSGDQLEDNCVVCGMIKKMIVIQTFLEYACDYYLSKKKTQIHNVIY